MQGLIRNGLVDVDSSGIVDDADTFVVKIADLNKTETEMVILVTMLCTVLDVSVHIDVPLSLPFAAFLWCRLPLFPSAFPFR